MDNKELLELIRSHIRAGRLPRSSVPHKLFGGKGDGGPCGCCGRLITAAQIQFEVDFAGALTVEMHLTCHDEWMKVSAALAPRPSGVDPAAPRA